MTPAAMTILTIPAELILTALKPSLLFGDTIQISLDMHGTKPETEGKAEVADARPPPDPVPAAELVAAAESEVADALPPDFEADAEPVAAAEPVLSTPPVVSERDFDETAVASDPDALLDAAEAVAARTARAAIKRSVRIFWKIRVGSIYW